MVEYTLEIETFKINDTTYRFEPVIEFETSTEEEPCSPVESYVWRIENTIITTKTATYVFSPCQDYEITLATSMDGIVHSAATILHLWKDIVPDFEISNNYGPAPLTFHVKDITDYSCGNFQPVKWTWYIIYYGCFIEGYGKGWERDFTISLPGQYGLKMVISDGITSYSIIKRNIIFVSLPGEADSSQIELAHESSPETMRHAIKSTHDFDTPEGNSIEFYMWGTELTGTEIAENKVAELRGDYKLITKNLNPFEDLSYNLGSETLRWEELIGKDIKAEDFTQSKILKLWSGK